MLGVYIQIIMRDIFQYTEGNIPEKNHWIPDHVRDGAERQLTRTPQSVMPGPDPASRTNPNNKSTGFTFDPTQAPEPVERHVEPRVTLGMTAMITLGGGAMQGFIGSANGGRMSGPTHSLCRRFVLC